MQETGRHKFLFNFVILVAELILMNVLYFIFLSIYHFEYNNTSYQTLLMLINLSYLLTVAIRRQVADTRNLYNIGQNIFVRLCITMIVTFAALSVTEIVSDVSHAFIAVFFAGLFVVFPPFHYLIKRIFDKATIKSRRGINAVILGNGKMGKRLYGELQSNPYLGIKVLGFFEDNEAKQDEYWLGPIDDVKNFVKENRVSKIYSTLPVTAQAKIKDILDFSENNIINFHITPAALHYIEGPLALESIGDMPIFSIRKIPLENSLNALIKRIFDVVGASIFLVFFFPFIYVILGTIIKLTSKGPVFFVQERTGKNGENFKCYKFRSMRTNADADKIQATANDSRKTKIGNFMRKTNLDELPQFYNVLKGDMSIVGPRPHMILHTEEYSNLVNKYMMRHLIKPGITGWAQVSGFRGETKDIKLMEGRIKKDIWYIENWSILLDLEIIARTTFNAIKGEEKAY